MSSIRKRGKKWLAEVRLKQGYKAKSFATKLEAQAWAVETEQLFNKNVDLVKGKTFTDVVSRYTQEISPTHKGSRWEVIRLSRLSESSIAAVPLFDLDAKDLELWMQHRLQSGVKNSTVNRELDLLSSVFNHAKKWKWMRYNPVADVVRPRNPPPRDRRISTQEIDRILDALGFDMSYPVVTQRQEIAVAFLFALETAMRKGEIWDLDWGRVQLKQRFVTLLETKNGTKRDVPLSSKAIVLLEKLSPKVEGKVFKSNKSSSDPIFRRALQLAGIEGLVFHDTRHEALTRLARKLDVLDLARMVGHRDPRSLMIYYNATASEIAQRLG